jgi:hypothetical protein
MALAHSKLTVQGQISVPAKVRQRLGVGLKNRSGFYKIRSVSPFGHRHTASCMRDMFASTPL